MAQRDTHRCRPDFAAPQRLATRGAGSGWRAALATGVASTALLAYDGRPVRAQTVPPVAPCNQITGINGSIVTCTGDVSAGVRINSGSPYSVLNVNNLTTDIAPAPGIDGISFTSSGAVTINSNTGAFEIITTGASAAGISASGDTSVTINSVGDIATYGDGSEGIAATSNTGPIAITSLGDITTYGVGADGISAITQGAASIVVLGDVSATGTGSAGIAAAGDAGNLITIMGNVVGGPCCAGVIMFSSGDNTLVNHGSISALSGSAIDSFGATNTVENFGTVTGDVGFIGSARTFNNHAGALFNTGTIVDAGIVTNDGTLAPGGAGLLQNTALGDNLIQGSTGKLAIELLGAGGYSDQVTVSGTAALAGNVVLSMLLAPVDPVQSFVILTAMSGTTNNALGLIASPALHATLSFPNANDVVLGISIDFTTTGLNPNQRAIADHLDQILAAGSGSVGPVLLGLLNTSDPAAYKAALDQLSPELYSDAEITALYSSLAFSNSLLSCKVNGTDTASVIREGQCLWAGASAVFLDAGMTSNQIGFSETAGLFTAGAQVALDEVWRLGFGAGYQSSTLQTATGAQSEGALGQAGVSIKYNPGPLLLAGAVSGGGGRYDTTRPLAFGGFTGVAEGDQNLGLVSGTLRAAYVLGSPHLYFKPILDMSLTHLELGGLTERGGGGAALTVAGSGQTVFSLAPTLEVGSEWWLSNATLVRPLIRAGAIWYDGADFALTASFAGAPVGVMPFTIDTEIDEVMGIVGAGLDLISGTDAVLRLSYDGQLGETTQIHSVGIKGSARF